MSSVVLQSSFENIKEQAATGLPSNSRIQPDHRITAAPQLRPAPNPAHAMTSPDFTWTGCELAQRQRWRRRAVEFKCIHAREPCTYHMVVQSLAESTACVTMHCSFPFLPNECLTDSSIPQDTQKIRTYASGPQPRGFFIQVFKRHARRLQSDARRPVAAVEAHHTGKRINLLYKYTHANL